MRDRRFVKARDPNVNLVVYRDGVLAVRRGSDGWPELDDSVTEQTPDFQLQSRGGRRRLLTGEEAEQALERFTNELRRRGFQGETAFIPAPPRLRARRWLRDHLGL